MTKQSRYFNLVNTIYTFVDIVGVFGIANSLKHVIQIDYVLRYSNLLEIHNPIYQPTDIP